MSEPEKLSYEGKRLHCQGARVGERFSFTRIETLKKRPKSGQWVKKDIGIGLGVVWYCDRKVEPCVRIQTFQWLGSATGRESVFSLKYARVSINFPVRIWVLKNTSIEKMLRSDHNSLTRSPDVATVLTVQSQDSSRDCAHKRPSQKIRGFFP